MQDIEKIRALVKSQARPEKVVSLVLRADIQQKIEELEKRLIAIRAADSDGTLAGNTDAAPVADEINALIEEAKESTVDVLLRALPRKQWSDLVTKNPPKSDDYLYEVVGLMNDAVPACWVTPELDTETLEALLDGITQGQWDRLCETTQMLNRGDVNVPFSALATRVHQGSGASEK